MPSQMGQRKWNGHSSPVTYPMSSVYLAGLMLAIAISAHWVQLGVGLLVFTLVAVVAFLVAVKREITAVRRQLAVQQEAFSRQQVIVRTRIEDLVAALDAAGVRVPSERRAGDDAVG